MGLKMYTLLEQVVLKAAEHNKYEENLDEVIQFCQKNFDNFLLRLQLPTFFINFQLTTEKGANITLPAVCTYL